MSSLVAKHLVDYQASAFSIVNVELSFRLDPTATRVKSRLTMVPNDLALAAQGLVLQGEQLTLVRVAVDGVSLSAADYRVTETELILPSVTKACLVEVETEINPQANSALEGLYRTDSIYCTQCEAEGFRRITYFLDRPDVMTTYQVRIEADKNQAPVLLSNGNLLDAGDLSEAGWHYAVWQDPYPKPSYLFALVAGDLVCQKRAFITAEGRQVSLEIYVKAHHASRCEHALVSLANAMKWDEQRFGLSYDLDRYMIVAVDDFNMGAMENKGLNVFNARFVLADPQTATDLDYVHIDSVIAHEYFHNWTGNRVTCRNWFQLTLKEGLTVFRDQLYTEETLLGKVKRIEDVRTLRSVQFSEDAGPLAHPIQPASYVEMNNFYTATVYEKGAEVVRMYQTLLGVEGFRRGMDLYFKRHDGQAVTVHEFRHAMADANGVDLSQMHHWYTQAGTPSLSLQTEWDAKNKNLQLHFKQYLAGKPIDLPLLIPVSLAIFDDLGNRQEVVLQQGQGSWQQSDGVLWLTEGEETVVFAGVTQSPRLSVLRDFSAPVKLVYERGLSDWLWQAAHDDDLFNRWEAWQQVWITMILAAVEQVATDQPMTFNDDVISMVADLLANKEIEANWLAEALRLPSFDYVAQHLDVWQVSFIVSAIDALKQWLASSLDTAMRDTVHRLALGADSQAYDADVIGKRALRVLLLSYLATLKQDFVFDWALQQVDRVKNMTYAQAALTMLVHQQAPQTETALSAFYQQFETISLVLDKWFSVQASNPNISIEQLDALCQHQKFIWTNPNRVRSVLGVFGRLNPRAFHRADGSGYRWLAGKVLEVDAINPQVAARLLQAFTPWRRLPEAQQLCVKEALLPLQRIDRLSRDSKEILANLLGVA